MNDTEEILRAAFAANAEPADAGFTRLVEVRINAAERRRAILLALLMAAGGLLLTVMMLGLFKLEHLWSVLQPAGLEQVSIWASTVFFAGIMVLTFSSAWSRGR